MLKINRIFKYSCNVELMVRVSLLRTDRELARVLQVGTDVLLGLGRLGNANTGNAKVLTGCLGRTVDANDRVTFGGNRASGAADGNVADGQGAGIIAVTVALLVLVTVVGGDKDRVINIVELHVGILDIRNGTLSTGPGLDTDTVLTVVTGTVSDTNRLDSFGLAALTKRTNAETVATVTDDVVDSQIGNAAIDSKTVIADSQLRVLEDDTFRRGDIQSIGVLGKIAAGGSSLEGNVVKDKVLGIGSTHVGSGSIDDVEVTDLGVCKGKADNSRSSVVTSIVPIVTELATVNVK